MFSSAPKNNNNNNNNNNSQVQNLMNLELWHSEVGMATICVISRGGTFCSQSIGRRQYRYPGIGSMYAQYPQALIFELLWGVSAKVGQGHA